jgi:hypothetical protein
MERRETNTRGTIRRPILFLLAGLALAWPVRAQELVVELAALQEEISSVDRPRIAVAPDGSYALALEILSKGAFESTPRWKVAVQRYSPQGSAIGPTHVFKGESCSTLDMWLSDWMEHPEIAFRPDNILLVLMQHAGRYVIGNDDVGSSEATLAAIGTDGQVIRLNNQANCEQKKLVFPSGGRQDRPRLAMAPGGAVLVTVDGFFGGSSWRNVAIRILDANLGTIVDEVIPHADASSQQSFHRDPDIATNGTLMASTWHQCRLLNAQGHFSDCDIGAQFATVGAAGELVAVGGNVAVNVGDPAGTWSIWPSVAMNPAGASVIVWADTRDGWAGEIYGQRFDAGGNRVGGNFLISGGQGRIYYRPEVAMLDNGGFLVAWTDSSSVGFRARGRQYTELGQPFSPPFAFVDESGLQAGRPAVASAGDHYRYTLLTARQGQVPSVSISDFGRLVSADPVVERPEVPSLHQNFPNPTNSRTHIEFALPSAGSVRLQVFDALGREVLMLADGIHPPGLHRVGFNVDGLPPGVYLVRLQAGSAQSLRTMTVVR